MSKVDHDKAIATELVQLARLALAGRAQDVQLFLYKLSKRHRANQPQLSQALSGLLKDSPTRTSPLRRRAEAEQAVPVDLDSRLQLLRVEHPQSLDVAPIFAPDVQAALSHLVEERGAEDRLREVGLDPTRSALFTGPPGVGKTLAARWLAAQLHKPLLILDLSAVMSSFLGRTGNNVRQVLDYAKTQDGILLLDELDAIAKRRDDRTEIGELKRLVTVLLQEIDDWPPSQLLLAATNHPDLLDPAVWRRFEMIVEFPLPTSEQVEEAVRSFIGADLTGGEPLMKSLAMVLRGHSFSDINRTILGTRRAAAVGGRPLAEQLLETIRKYVEALPKSDRVELARTLTEAGVISQRDAHELTGVSRDTIRKAVREHGAESTE